MLSRWASGRTTAPLLRSTVHSRRSAISTAARAALAKRLTQHDPETPGRLKLCWLDAAVSLEGLTTKPDRIAELERLVCRVGRDEPLAYVIGHQPFGGLKLRTRAPTLIPRPETEHWALQLADIAARDPAWPLANRQRTVLDLCSGSGCIALLLAARLPRRSTVIRGFDVAPAAVELANENALHLRATLGNDVSFGQLDLRASDAADRICAALDGDPVVDMVVCNPPYIAPADYRDPSFAASVRDHEDPVALIGELEGAAAHEGHGLAFYRLVLDLLRGLSFSPRSSSSAAPSLVFEVGQGQAEAVASLCRARFRRVETREDQYGVARTVWAWTSSL